MSSSCSTGENNDFTYEQYREFALDDVRRAKKHTFVAGLATAT
jgi:hypothetical protein